MFEPRIQDYLPYPGHAQFSVTRPLSGVMTWHVEVFLQFENVLYILDCNFLACSVSNMVE